MSDVNPLTDSEEGPQPRRQHTALPPPPSTLIPPSTADELTGAPMVERSTEALLDAKQHGMAWSLLDVLALLLVAAVVVAVAATAPQLFTHYRALGRNRAEASVTVWTGLRTHLHRLPLIRQVAATTATQHVRSTVGVAFGRLAADLTFARYGDTRIFFRPLPRKVHLIREDVADVVDMVSPRQTPSCTAQMGLRTR